MFTLSQPLAQFFAAKVLNTRGWFSDPGSTLKVKIASWLIFCSPVSISMCADQQIANDFHLWFNRDRGREGVVFGT